MEEIVIIGSGCAGMGAAIYAARAGMSPLVIEGAQPGGLLTTTSDVENFPGFPEGVNGFDLLWKMREQAQKFGARIENAVVEKVDFSGETKKVFCSGEKVFEAKKIVVATGSSPRMTGAKGEAEMYGGKGVSACATCDGAFYRGKDVAVVGGGDSACEEAVFLTRFCSSVKIIHRRGEFRASKIMADRALSNPKIEPVWDSVVDEILPDENGLCRGVAVRNAKTGEKSEIACKAVFVAIGHKPNTDIFKGILEMDDEGYIVPLSGTQVKTNVENVFVAGDCADKTFRQAITASAMGCMAAILASS
ncbi:MAG: thioredoxin-disulfide reductase [Verrucomicrobia bacterium CAG:312_58_20]|nr:MAG: thioredoxin-disulfide reductase [Verrucomicrobia bacterium CAG:312_58_20]PWL64803.1 MAG: thioredoxin-disulfide reductase [Verrucomicrobiota bacterium]